jgi:hypothetical protein
MALDKRICIRCWLGSFTCLFSLVVIEALATAVDGRNGLVPDTSLSQWRHPIIFVMGPLRQMVKSWDPQLDNVNFGYNLRRGEMA